MGFFSFPVRRPVTIVMGMLIILIVGGISLWKMPLELIPKITYPHVLISYTYEGASPEEIEKTIARPAEQAIKTVSDIKDVTATASEGMLMIDCEFNWGTDLAAASVDAREKIDLIKKYLPEGVDDPIIMRIDVTELPVVYMYLEGENRNISELGDIADDIVAPILERLPGVATVGVLGKQDREIHVDVDRDKLRAYGLSLDGIANAIRYQNLDLSAGNMDIGNTRFRIRGEGEFANIEQIQNLVVGYGISQARMQSNQIAALTGMASPLAGTGAISPVRIKDVAEVVDGLQEPTGRAMRVDYKGEHTGIGIAVMKETDANLVNVAQTVKDALPKIQKELPKGIELGISFDFSEFITDSLNALETAAVEGGLFAVIILFIFLWEIVPTLIISVSIPLSLLFAFVCMYFSGYSLNIMTMGGLVIALGKVVDDSIVVLENIYRHIQLGDEPKLAAEVGAREVAVADIAATIVAVVIFLPIVFITGLSAQLFRAFSGTIFFALFGSLIAAFTAVPMLSSRLLSKHTPKPGKKVRHPFQHIQNIYVSLLGWTLDNRGKVMLLALLVLVLTGMMVIQTPTEFIPRLVAGIYRGNIKLPLGTPFEQTSKVLSKIQKQVVAKVPDFTNFFIMIGETEKVEEAARHGGAQATNETMVILKMQKFAKGRKTTDDQLRQIWSGIASENPAADVSFAVAGGIMQGMTKPLVLKIFGDDISVLKFTAENLKEKIKKVDGVLNVTTSAEQGTPELVLTLDQRRLFNYGIATAQAQNAMRTAVYGQLASRYREAGKEYDIMVRLKRDQRQNLKDLGEIPLASPMGFTVPLKDVGEFKYSEGPGKVVRENSKRVVTIEADKTDRPLSEIKDDIEAILASHAFPEGYFWGWGGEIEQQGEAFSDLGIMFALALLLVYMVLAALYESMVHPFTILAAVPFAFTGAIILLYITGIPLGVTAFIGMIMLVGIVANNSILLIDFVLTYHRQGMSRREAVIQAGKVRLRPILMTALATLIAVVPIALGRAEGLEIQQPLGVVVVGGLFSSTILTLLIIPVVYTIFDDVAEDVKNLARKILKRKAEPAPELFKQS